MRLNMHEDTPTPVTSKIPKVLVVLIIGWISLVIGLVVFCLCYYAQQYFCALVLVIMILLCISMCWLGILDLKKSYIDIDSTKITVVEYNLGIKKVKTFYVSDIKYVTYSNGNALAIKGSRNKYTEYIILRGVKKKYLFKIIDTPKTREYFENLITQKL